MLDRSGDREELFCSAGDCLDGAVAYGQVTVEVGAAADATPGEERLTFSLPLCHMHARLLGFDTTIVAFSNGLHDDGVVLSRQGATSQPERARLGGQRPDDEHVEGDDGE